MFFSLVLAACSTRHSAPVETLVIPSESGNIASPNKQLQAIDSLMHLEPLCSLQYDLVDKAIAYYDSTGNNPSLLAKAYYYKGYLDQNQDSILNAARNYMKAIDIMENNYVKMTSEQAELTGLMYEMLGSLMAKEFANVQSNEAYSEAARYALSAHDTLGYFRDLRQLAAGFEAIGDYDSSLYFFDSLFHTIDSVRFAQQYIEAQYDFGSLFYDKYYETDSVDFALAMQADAIAAMERKGFDATRMKMGYGVNLYFAQRMECLPYLKLGLETDYVEGRGAIAGLLADVYEQLGNADSASYYRSLAMPVLQQAQYKAPARADMVSLFENWQRDKTARMATARHHRTTIAVVVALCILLFLCALFAIWHYVKTKKKHVLALETFQADNALRSKKVKESLAEQLKLIYKVSTMNRNKVISDETDYEKVKRYLYGAKNVTVWDAVRQCVAETYPNLYAQMAEAYPMLSEVELKICLLSAFGFRTDEIADIAELKSSTVSSYKTNIRKKVENLPVEGIAERFI